MRAEEKSALDFSSASTLEFDGGVFVDVHSYVYFLDEWTVSGYVPLVVSFVCFLVDTIFESGSVFTHVCFGGHFVGKSIVVDKSVFPSGAMPYATFIM